MKSINKNNELWNKLSIETLEKREEYLFGCCVKVKTCCLDAGCCVQVCCIQVNACCVKLPIPC